MIYEDAVKELDEIVKKLNSEALPIEEAKKLFERGKDLSKFCYEQVKGLKGKIFELKEELGKLIEEKEEI